MNDHSQSPISPVQTQAEVIEDADSQGEIEEEGVEPMVKRMEQRPSQEDVDQHMLTHIPYRSWCDHCVRGRAVNDHHKKSRGQESSIPVISIVYAYFGETSDERKERKNKEKNGESTQIEEMPFIAVKDRMSKKVWAFLLSKRKESIVLLSRN